MEQQPESLSYSVGEMRRHFAGCLEDKLIRHFQAKMRNLRKATKRVEVMNVFCTCRIPEEDGERMISCDSCKQWFHEKCITVPEEAWTDDSYIWYCIECQ